MDSVPRLESIAKAGYYPTPDPVVDAVAAMIRPGMHGSRVAVRLLDPCAGTGAALRRFAEVVGGETFGIELDDERYAEAVGLLDHVLPGSALSARVEEAAFSCAFVNPPYDLDLDARRLEHTFLTRTTPLLCPRGLLIYIVPQRRLAMSARYLASYYRDLECWRFPGDLFERFEQVVVLGTKREEPVSDAAARAAIESWATGELPELPSAGAVRARHALPVLPAGDLLFTSFGFDAEEAAAEARRSGVWTHASLTERLWPPEEQRVRPLMPLRRGHIAVMVAAGFLDSIVLESKGRRLMVKGRTYKVWVPVYSPDPKVEVEREALRTSVTVLDLRTGEVQVVDTGGSRE